MNKALIQRPIAVSMCVIALVVMGWLALMRIPVSLMPKIDIPQITVQASMPGYSAQEIEKEVLSPLRGRLMQVAGVTDLPFRLLCKEQGAGLSIGQRQLIAFAKILAAEVFPVPLVPVKRYACPNLWFSI